ncbi:MAG TPA: hypothetical protein VGM26_05310 [Rhizomicrobium sp.]
MNIRFLFLLLLATLSATTAPAMARPRDDVMSGAFRCAAIGDSKVWLDCYYGAAQSVRAALGMQPASAAQVKLASAPPAGNPTAADISVRDDVMSGAFRCNGQADDRQWLNCYYGAAQPMRGRLGLSAAPQMHAVPVPAPVPVPVQQFGKAPPPPATIPANVDHVTANMQSYSFDKLGWFTVTLDNGQVWKQVHGDTDFAKWKKPAAGYQVRVSRGFLNSFSLQVKGQPGLYKVLRVQ